MTALRWLAFPFVIVFCVVMAAWIAWRIPYNPEDWQA